MTFRWLPRNWCDTSEPGDPPPLELAMTPPQALEFIQGIIAGLPRWQVVKVDAPTGRIEATHKTGLWGFVDDVTLRLEESPGDLPQTRVHVRSQSRVGLSDLGQNRRNILELFAALKQEKTP